MSEPGFDNEPGIDPGPAWLGPKASEDDIPVTRRFGGGLTLRAVLPNAITAAALCSGLTGIRFAIAAAYGHEGDWQKALLAIVFAAGAIGIAALRRYKLILDRAEHLAERSTCPQCAEYGRIAVVSSGAPAADTSDAPWMRVECRKCGKRWLIE